MNFPRSVAKGEYISPTARGMGACPHWKLKKDGFLIYIEAVNMIYYMYIGFMGMFFVMYFDYKSGVFVCHSH